MCVCVKESLCVLTNSAVIVYLIDCTDLECHVHYYRSYTMQQEVFVYHMTTVRFPGYRLNKQ